MYGYWSMINHQVQSFDQVDRASWASNNDIGAEQNKEFRTKENKNGEVYGMKSPENLQISAVSNRYLLNFVINKS